MPGNLCLRLEPVVQVVPVLIAALFKQLICTHSNDVFRLCEGGFLAFLFWRECNLLGRRRLGLGKGKCPQFFSAVTEVTFKCVSNADLGHTPMCDHRHSNRHCDNSQLGHSGKRDGAAERPRDPWAQMASKFPLRPQKLGLLQYELILIISASARSRSSSSWLGSQLFMKVIGSLYETLLQLVRGVPQSL